MNAIRNVLCSSGWWARRVEHELLPWGTGAVDLGDDVLEIGPGWLFKTIHSGDVLRRSIRTVCRSV